LQFIRSIALLSAGITSTYIIPWRSGSAQRVPD
jgi:hypothetical protein